MKGPSEIEVYWCEVSACPFASLLAERTCPVCGGAVQHDRFVAATRTEVRPDQAAVCIDNAEAVAEAMTAELELLTDAVSAYLDVQRVGWTDAEERARSELAIAKERAALAALDHREGP